MRLMRFAWSVAKAESNWDKHGVSFAEACTCFEDLRQVAWYDPDHSDDEDRELLVGHSDRGRLLVISYTVREPEVVRIISARRATPRETRIYAQGI
jgi:uncharacterized protein